jgi:mannan endo-1,4-beta-mannosidase
VLVLVSACLTPPDRDRKQGSGAQGNSRAQQLLSYLHSLPDRKAGRVVSGQFLGNEGLSDVADISARTGHWLGLIGEDYYQVGSTSRADTSVNRFLIDYWRNGGLVTLTSHMPNPQTGGPVNDRSISFADVVTPGTRTNTEFMRTLDDIAAGLEQLKDAGVVVMYRPFHEMNGDWFWWGAHDAARFQQMWRHVHDYLVDARGLDNLLFVYSPNTGEDVMKFYPGGEYVDVVALDYYGNTPARMKRDYHLLLSTGKPFAIGEFGPGGAGVDQVPTGWDFRVLMHAIRTALPRTVWWQSWAGVWGMQNGSQVTAVLDDPWVLTRDEISF